MQFKIFTIPVVDNGTAIEEMNRFLRSHKVLEAEQQLVSTKTARTGMYHVISSLRSNPGANKESGLLRRLAMTGYCHLCLFDFSSRSRNDE